MSLINISPTDPLQEFSQKVMQGHDLTKRLGTIKVPLGKQGGSGVALATWLDNTKLVVLKRLKEGQSVHDARNKINQDHVAREARLWLQLHHPNVLPLYGFALDKSDSHLPQYVSPYLPEGTAVDFIRKKLASSANSDRINKDRLLLIADIAAGLGYIHVTKNMVHGDLKGNNVLITHIPSNNEERCLIPRAVICDFGLTRLDGDAIHTNTYGQGTLRYTAWEISKRQDFHAQLAWHTSASRFERLQWGDIWAFGMTALELMSDFVPWWKHDDADVPQVASKSNPFDHSMYQRIDNKDRRSLLEKCRQYGMKEELEQLLRLCWHRDPGQRSTMEDIVKAMGVTDRIQSSPQEALSSPTGAFTVGEPKKPILFYVRALRPSHPQWEKGRRPSRAEMFTIEEKDFIAVRPCKYAGWWEIDMIVKTNREPKKIKPFDLDGGTAHSKFPCLATVNLRSAGSATSAEPPQTSKHFVLLLRVSDDRLYYIGELAIVSRPANAPRFFPGHIVRPLCNNLTEGKGIKWVKATAAWPSQDRDIELEPPRPAVDLKFRAFKYIGVTEAPETGRWKGELASTTNQHHQGEFWRDYVTYI